VPSIPGDLVDLLTRNGTFAFLEVPARISGMASNLSLVESYPAQSLPL
jgi:hypothetical protein